MSKTLELVVILFLLIFSFVAGVVYSPSVRANFDWLFEVKEQEIEVVPEGVNNAHDEKEIPIASEEIQAIETVPTEVINTGINTIENIQEEVPTN